MKTTLGILAIILAFCSSAEARHHRVHHYTNSDFAAKVVTNCDENSGRCTNFTHYEPMGERAAGKVRKRYIEARGCSNCVTVPTAAGLDITVDATYAPKFQALVADLVASGHKPRFITCYARGHRAGSNHSWGGACDIDQTGWGRTANYMYHSDSLIHNHGLHSGCAFRHQDCGHVEAVTGLGNRPPSGSYAQR